MAIRWKTRYPFDGYRWIICGQSGKRVHARDAILVTDENNIYQRGMVVAKDQLDVANPQWRIKTVLEVPVESPGTVRPDTDPIFVDTNSDPEKI